MTLNKLSLISSFTLISFVGVFAKTTATPDHTPTRPNFLLLYADDQRNHTLGCAGHPIVKKLLTLTAWPRMGCGLKMHM